jgi:predicted XRE-type DNA-binding protein
MIANRINILCVKLNLNQHEFARAIGYTQPRISQIFETKQIKRPKKLLDAICKSFPQVSRTWLMTGQGEMFMPEQPSYVPRPTSHGLLPLHETQQYYTPYPGDPPDLPELIGKFLDVMRSDDVITREALKQNVIAFHLSIHRAEGKPPQPGSNDFKSKRKRAV